VFSFTIEEFLLVLERYNLSIWPIQIFAYILGVLALFFAVKSTKYSDRIVLSILSFYWFWNGIVFCPIYWGPTYKYAYVFGALCILIFSAWSGALPDYNLHIWILLNDDKKVS